MRTRVRVARDNGVWNGGNASERHASNCWHDFRRTRRVYEFKAASIFSELSCNRISAYNTGVASCYDEI